MFGDGTLAFAEFVTREPLPLATIQEALLESLRDRADVALFGAQAINAYVDEPRMTQDVDVLSTRAREVAEELRELLASRFGIAVRIREVSEGRGFRLYQLSKPRNRQLADVRQVERLPPSRRIGGVLVASPAELAAQKLLALHARAGRPKAFTDRRDLAVLLLAFPELRAVDGPVRERLRAAAAAPAVDALWETIAREEILPEEDEA